MGGKPSRVVVLHTSDSYWSVGGKQDLGWGGRGVSVPCVAPSVGKRDTGEKRWVVTSCVVGVCTSPRRTAGGPSSDGDGKWPW